MLTKAIVRPPAPNFAEGLTTADLGVPNYDLGLRQHEAYCTALERCGLTLTRLEPDPIYPDSTFVEDAAVLCEHGAIITRPGAPSRAGEVASIRKALVEFFPALSEIQSPGTMDGGDVCHAGKHFFIGISARTNEAGAQQLAESLAHHDYTSSFIDIRDRTGLLHLKSGIAHLGNNRLVVSEGLANREEFREYDLVRVNADEAYAANCVRLNDHVLVAAGYLKSAGTLCELGYKTITLDMTEFQKMDGGLSCLSLRW